MISEPDVVVKSPLSLRIIIKPFILVVGTAMFLAWLFEYLFITDSVYFNTFSEQLDLERIQEILNTKETWGWLIYSLVPLVYLSKFMLVAGCIWIGLTMLDSTVSFASLLDICIRAEAIFLVASLCKILWFAFVVSDSYNLNDVQYFYPFSLLNYFDAASVDPLLLYPLQLVNPFELLYCIVLAWELKKLVGRMTFVGSLKVVLLTYGVGLVFWIVLLSFLLVGIV